MREEEKRKVGSGVKQKGRKGTNERTGLREKCVCMCARAKWAREEKKEKGEKGKVSG